MADAGTNPVRPNSFEMEADVNVEFNEASSRQQINSGESVKTLFGKIRKFLTDLKAVAFSGAYSDLSGVPDLTQYALKSKYGDTTINVGRKAGTEVGKCSTAEGYGNTASGNYSHAECEFTTASGGYSHAEGIHTTASGEISHAEGNDTTASGANSHAEGVETTASGLASHAGGKGTKALHYYEVAYGIYNLSNDDTLFSIGDGTADDARHNAIEITKTGGKLHDKDIATMGNISNPNLLINPDFKINQRGISGTFSETGKYFVDRWRLVSGAVTVNADGTLTLNGTISQIFENAVGDNVTTSVSAGTATYDNSTKTFSITANGEIISWAKLEYGSNATQFISPDTATELPKCMRYYEILMPSGVDRAVTGFLEIDKKAIFDMKFSVPKRCVPSLTSNSIRIIVNTFDSYLAILNSCPVSQGVTDKHGIVITSADPVISSDPSGYIGASMDTIHNADLAVDAEIY